MVQAAFQTVFTEGVATQCRHRLIEQPVFIKEMQQLFRMFTYLRVNNVSCHVCMLPTGPLLWDFTSCRESTQSHWGPADLWEHFCRFYLWQAGFWSFSPHLESTRENKPFHNFLIIWQLKYRTVGRALSSDLVFYACYFLCRWHRVPFLTLTTSSSAGFPSPGPPAEVQSKLSSAPPHHN